MQVKSWQSIISLLRILFSYLNPNIAISINLVGIKFQAYESRPNGGMGIYWNLHISVEEI